MLQFEVLTFGIHRTAIWRRGLLERFPEDMRNARAAEMLEVLAKTPASEVDQAIWQQVEPLLSSRKAREAISVAGRKVGFAERPRNLNDFLVILLDILWESLPSADGANLAAVLPQGGAR